MKPIKHCRGLNWISNCVIFDDRDLKFCFKSCFLIWKKKYYKQHDILFMIYAKNCIIKIKKVFDFFSL